MFCTATQPRPGQRDLYMLEVENCVKQRNYRRARHGPVSHKGVSNAHDNTRIKTNNKHIYFSINSSRGKHKLFEGLCNYFRSNTSEHHWIPKINCCICQKMNHLWKGNVRLPFHMASCNNKISYSCFFISLGLISERNVLIKTNYFPTVVRLSTCRNFYSRLTKQKQTTQKNAQPNTRDRSKSRS